MVPDSNDPDTEPEVERGELVKDGASGAVVPDAVLPDAVVPDAVLPEEVAVERREAVEEPAKVMRIGSMMKQLLEEVRTVALDEPARDRLKEIYGTSIKELGTALSPDLRDELERVTIPFGGEHPTDGELIVAQAQLVGWLEGLFHGIQAMLFAQQMATRSQMEDPRRQIGPGGAGGPGGPGADQLPGSPGDERPGTYL